LLLLHVENWTGDLVAQAEVIERELGYFEAPEVSDRHDDEYPPESGTAPKL
jgi:hypothetical protein